MTFVCFSIFESSDLTGPICLILKGTFGEDLFLNQINDIHIGDNWDSLLSNEVLQTLTYVTF